MPGPPCSTGCWRRSATTAGRTRNGSSARLDGARPTARSGACAGRRRSPTSPSTCSTSTAARCWICRYEERRAELEALALESEAWQVPAFHRGDGQALLSVSVERGLPGIVAKRLASSYAPGKRKRDWLEVSA